ncbi:tetratricopeptide repeat protein, partial [Actinomyces sp. ICM47]|uniref:tetratricopeptide repeat protein n=1 Tax=Actinomyces sp. ICM47 TaxID=936548 RepID=UPI0002733782
AREAVRLRRVLAEASPQAYTPDLAGSLNNLAIRLSEVGERGEALVVAREAVDAYQVLAEASPQAYTPDLAASLSNLANCLSSMGDRDRALVVAREAVRLRRVLVEASPQAYRPDLARSLNNLANHLSEVGERGEALVVAREAVELRRVLAEASPQAYTPNLAMSLNNLANHLSEVGERGEALVVAREAVELYRGLAEASPQAYTPNLAATLNNLANRLSAVGERNEALEAAREAVELYRALAEDSPQAYTPDLAISLNNLANYLSEVGKLNEALETFVEGFDGFSPAVRARLLVARATWRDDGGEAGDVVAAAREADSTDDPVLLGPVRRMIARVITDVGISDTGLPRWATVDAESATSRIEGWLECSDLAQRVAFLEAQWSSPSASEKETLAALAELYVELPPVAALAAFVERIADSGIQAVTTDLRIHYRARLLARDWREAHVSGRGVSFLREHMRGNPDASRDEDQINKGDKQESGEWEKDLGDPDMRTRVLQVLAAMLPEAEAASMASVLALAELTDPRTAYDAQRSDEGAEDMLREFLEARNWLAMTLVLGVRPSVAESTYGSIALLLFAAVTDEPVERLRELYDYANEEMDAIHRRQLQALLDKALGTAQSPKLFSDLLLWVKE